MKEVGSRYQTFILSAMSCLVISDGDVVCGDCLGILIDVRKMVIRRAEFCNWTEEPGRNINHRYLLSTPAVAIPYLQSEAEQKETQYRTDPSLQTLQSTSL